MDLYIQLFRLLFASTVGIIVGIERTKRRKSAGVGTFSIICISSCFLTLISTFGFPEGSDGARLISNIVTAVGFVCGGVIFTKSTKHDTHVKGLTTGAEIFCIASLGIGIGLGLYIQSLAVVILLQINILIAIKFKKIYGSSSSFNKGKENKHSASDDEDI